MSEIVLNSSQFNRRCQLLCEKVKVPLLIMLGKPADVEEFNINSALFHYLLGYEFPETIIIVQPKPIAFTSPKKALMLSQIENLKVVVKNKDDSNLKEILDSLNDLYGLVDVNNIKGDFCQLVLSRIRFNDITPLVINAFTVKEDTELDIINKCALVSNFLLQKGIDLVRDMNFSKEELETHMNVNIRGVDNNLIEYSFDPEHSPTHVRLGIRYRGYCTEIARPFLTDLTEEYEIQKYAISLIKPGLNSLEVINSIKKFILERDYQKDVMIYTIGLLHRERDFEDGFILERNTSFVLNISDAFSNTFVLDSVPILITKKDAKEDYSEAKMRFRNKHNDMAAIMRMKEHQKDLLDKLVEEQILYYRNNTSETDLSKKEDKGVIHYEKDSAVPRSEKIYLDWDKMHILVPILSYSIPFHISSVKNVLMITTEQIPKLRINFKDMRSSAEIRKGNSEDSAGYDTSIKSISIRSNNCEDLILNINEMKKEFNKPTHHIREQPALKEKFKKAAMTDLYMRTDAKSATKKVTSNLELHENGLKYLDTVILFANIKNVFFQSGDLEDRALIHFNLKDPIMVGGKPTLNLQFFKKFGFVYHDTNKREDEHADLLNQQEEEEEIYRINQQFQAFIGQIEDETSIRVQIPQRGFLGVHAKESVHMSVTNECLLSIAEQPFFVLNFDDVEIVNFERVTFITKTFDCVFVFKNKIKAPISINSIETTKLAFIKELLDSHNIVFMETKGNINWTNLMNTIMKDSLSFYESGGWAELIREDDSEEDSDTESDDSSDTSESTVSSTTSTDDDDDTSYDTTEDEPSSIVSEDEDYDESEYNSDDDSDESSRSRNKKRRR